MGPGEGLTQAKAQRTRHRGPQNHLHRCIPHAAPGQRCGVQLRIRQRGTDDAVALEVIAQADGDHLRDQRIGPQGIDGAQLNIAGRHIQVEHAGQNELHRAALGTHHHIDTSQVAIKSTLHLVGNQQQKRDGRQPQRQQQHVQNRRQRPRPEVAPGQSERVHAATSSRSKRGRRRVWTFPGTTAKGPAKKSPTRASWVAITRVAP